MKNQEKKYYTPDISEFHVGFELELKPELIRLPDLIHPKRFKSIEEKIEFTKTALNAKDILNASLSPNFIKTNMRVKYLDREDIESLGWKYFEQENKDFCSNYIKQEGFRNYYMNFYYEKDCDEKITFPPVVCIYGGNIGSCNLKIKNKSELKKIMQMIEIE